MAYEFKLPDPGEGIHEAEIVEVLVEEGESVEEDQSVLVIETDKATTEIPSPVDGTVKEIRVKAGDTAKVGDILMVFEEEGAEPEEEEGERAVQPDKGKKDQKDKKDVKDKPPKAEKDQKDKKKAEKDKPEKEPEPEAEEEEKPEKKSEPEAEEEEEEETEKKTAEREEEKEKPSGKARKGPVPAAPSTRRLARELGVDINSVPPTGPGGRVMAEDVKKFAGEEKKTEAPEKKPEKPEKVGKAEKAEGEKPEREAPEEKKSREETKIEAPGLPDFSKWGPVERVALRSVRRATAKQMALAWSQIPHVTHQDEADITDLEDFRQHRKENVEADGGALTMTIFALKAAVAGLKKYPNFNASLDMEAGEIIYKRHYHIGVAVDTERGLLVPVVRDVDRKSLVDLAKELPELAQRTRDRKLDREEMSGGTFTITNIGSLGGTAFTPIINYPQTAIMGMAKARMRPIITDKGRIAQRLMLPILVGFDHRIADGADAARFLNIVIRALSHPEEMMMVI